MDTTKRMYASERDGAFRLAMALEFLVTATQKLERQLKMVPGGKRDTAMMDKRLTKLLNDVLDTAPAEQRANVRRNLDMISYTIGAARPGKQDHNRDYGVWMSYEMLQPIINALKDHCLMCDKNLMEQRKCPLQAALDTMGTNVPDAPCDGCHYRGVL